MPCATGSVTCVNTTGTAVTFHYLNRMVNVLLVDSFLPQARWVRRTLSTALPWLLRPLARRTYTPGVALQWLPTAAMPNDLGWAQGAPTIARAALCGSSGGASPSQSSPG